MIVALLLVPKVVQADDVYLLTEETINGVTGKYEVPSKHPFTNSSGTEYTYTITSMPADGFYFRIGVNGEENTIYLSNHIERNIDQALTLDIVNASPQ